MMVRVKCHQFFLGFLSNCHLHLCNNIRITIIIIIIIKSSNHQIIIVTIIMITIIMITIIIIITNLALPVMAKPGESSKRRGNTSTKTHNLTCPALVNADGYYCADFEIAYGAA